MSLFPQLLLTSKLLVCPRGSQYGNPVQIGSVINEIGLIRKSGLTPKPIKPLG